MKILRNYVLKECIFPFFLALGVLTCVFLLGNLIQLANLVVNKGVRLATIGQVFLYLIPVLIGYTLPIACFFLMGLSTLAGILTPLETVDKLKRKSLSILIRTSSETPVPPGEEGKKNSAKRSQERMQLQAKTPWYLSHAYGHFFFFAGLTFCFILVNGKTQALRLLGYLLLFAFVSEVLQFFAEGRNPKLVDFLIDVSGIFLAFLVCPRNRRDFEMKN